MDSSRFDRIAKVFADRRRSHRRALVGGSATNARRPDAERSAASVQDATPVPDANATTDAAGRGPTMLFVQTYQSGAITPVDGVDGRYTLTLEAGSGQTVYFSDRPDRVVGASPTPAFLEGLGFPTDNPPNAALVVETAPGETDVAVVELFAPLYDPVSQGVTYEVEVLANWQTSLELGLTEAPTDLAALAPSFGSAHLFIDDCPNGEMICYVPSVSFDEWYRDRRLRRPSEIQGSIPSGDHEGFCYNWEWLECLPCEPWIHNLEDAYYYWAEICNQRFSACNGRCQVWQLCTSSLGRCF